MGIVLAVAVGACARAAPTPAEAPRTAPPFDPRPWLDDYATLRAHLERAYANLSWFASPASGVNLPALHERTLSALRSTSDAVAAEAALDAFIAGFHDGHLSRLPRAESPAGPPAAMIPPPDRSSAPALGCGALGYARTRGVAFSVRFEATPGFRLLSSGEPESFRSGVATLLGGRTIGILRIPSYRSIDFVAECEHAWSELAQAQARGPCDKGCVDAVGRRVMELALAALRARLRALAEAGVDAVVVDLGGNGGGNDLGDWAPRAFTSAPVRSARLGLVGDPRSVAYFEEQLDSVRDVERTETSERARDALAHARRELERLEALAKSAPPCAMGWVWTEQRAWSPLATQASCTNLLFGETYASGATDYLPAGALGSPKAEQALYWPTVAFPVVGSWTGAVYAIIDGRTASAAEISAAVLQDNRVARLLGTKTAGLGCGFMYPGSEITLPNARFRYRVPNCVRLRADGSSEVAGVRPDIDVPTYESEREPERAMRFLSLIEHGLPDR